MVKKQFPLIYLNLICLLISLGAATELPAHKRVFARVEPNAGTIESTGELYDQDSGKSASTAAMMTPRRAPTATLLPDGRVLITGGYNFTYLDSAEIYDPASDVMAPTEGFMSEARGGHRATLLSSGLVLITGGYNGVYQDSAEVYIPSVGTFDPAKGDMTIGRAWHSATLLSDNRVLLAGGYNGSYLSSAETYDPSTGSFTATEKYMTALRCRHSATVLWSGRVLLAGGYSGEHSLDSAETYDHNTDTFSRTGGVMTVPRESHTATLLKDGTVLFVGGRNDDGAVRTAEIYNPYTGTFTATRGMMAHARYGHTATSLRDGRVLILGGTDGSEIVDVVEIYDPLTGSFTPAEGTMCTARRYHASVSLPNGNVLTFGGENSEPLTFDINREQSDNIAPNIAFSSDSKRGFVGFTGTGTVMVFSTETGEIVKLIETGGQPASATPLPDNRTLAVVSAFDDKVFMIDMDSNEFLSTYTYHNAYFGFGSIVTLTRDGNIGYISSTGSGEVIKFNPADGSELGRAGGLQAPAQITLSSNEGTLLVVDTYTDDLVFIDAASLARKFSLNDQEAYSTAGIDFTIFNKAVLSPDGSRGILASRQNDGNYFSSDTLFYFDANTAEILDTAEIGSGPGYASLTPNKEQWVILNNWSLSRVSTEDFDDRTELSMRFGEPLGSANIVFSTDSKYAFYVSSADDLFFQHDLENTAIVDQVRMGDDPDLVLDQPSSIGLTPDGKTLAVLNYVSNTIELLRDVTVMEATKFISSGNSFTSLSLVNLSDSTAQVSIIARDNDGVLLEGDEEEDEIVNPAVYTLQPNHQISMTVDEIFRFDDQVDRIGRLILYSDRSEVVGYVSYGKMKTSWLGSYIDRMDGVPLLRERFHDWIVPEIKLQEGHSLELNFVNPNYNYDDTTSEMSRFGRYGELVETRDASYSPQHRSSGIYDELFFSSQEGIVLMVGGQDSELIHQTAEIYNVGEDSFSETDGTMETGRLGHTATLLPTGSVLFTGGYNDSYGCLDTAELYDPSADTFVETLYTMGTARNLHTATLLHSGKVLIAGGYDGTQYLDRVEIFDAETESFVESQHTMNVPRGAHTATRLLSGEILFAGGSNGSGSLDSAELYDPNRDSFTAVGQMTSPRAYHTATLLPSGRVLITGGSDGVAYLDSAEIYDPSTGSFQPTAGSMTSARGRHDATVFVPSGLVLISGGYDVDGSILRTAEIFDPVTETFATTASNMEYKRVGHTSTMLPTGKVLLAGGVYNSDDDGNISVSNAVDSYNSDTNTFSSVTRMTEKREGHTATLLHSDSGEDESLRISSELGILSTAIYEGPRTTAVLHGIEVSKLTDVNKIFAPHFALASGIRTNLNIINGNEENAEITLTLHAPDGSIIARPVTKILLNNGQIKGDLMDIFGNDPALNDTTGWIEIESSVDLVGGTVSFTNPEETFLSTVELSSSALNDFVFPIVASDNTYGTGVALLNSNDESSAVTIELWSPYGTLEQSVTLILPPLSREALYLREIFPGLDPNLIANLRIHSELPLHGFAMLSDHDYRFLCAVTPIPFPPAED